MNGASRAYPTILKKTESGYSVFVPDLNIEKEGRDIASALSIVKESIKKMVLKCNKEGIKIPYPHSKKFEHNKDDILTLVEINFKDLMS
ncbi:hypothetical protein SAMN05216454_10845 [Peptostreptococcus russellii]|uniref:HicB-like antitoxin of toxin-antitoxin system domain-containing protein n=2 Tax=Peptostreptococcus russellii TaxID=215200 RepID=A0A1H8IK71_9FIRM|nr:hypothetical protein [Peptostreptococcus russellii]SEN68679.1 hypothetical protein SAMN05216454_10845 [Peptostreptococcus russellii]